METIEWEKTKREIKLALPKTTYSAWIENSHAIKWNDNELHIRVVSTYAKEWIDNRLKKTIEEHLRNITSISNAVIVTHPPEHNPKIEIESVEPTKPDKPTEPTTELQFNGFKKIKSHYTQIPNELIDNLIPHLKPATVILVITTFRKTVGVVHPKGERNKEWFSTHKATQKICGISETSCRTAIKEAVQIGLLSYREITDENERTKTVQKYSIEIAPRELLYALKPAWINDLSP